MRYVYGIVMVVYMACCTYAILGFLVFFALGLALGGHAMGGHAENGRYFLKAARMSTEVSPRVFHAMWWLEFASYVSIGVVVIGALIGMLARKMIR